MRRNKNLERILKQAIKFFGISGIGWLLDFLTYLALNHFINNPTINNIISSWVGVTFVFVFGTRKVFKNNSKISLKWKYIIYLAYQFILIFLISKLLGYINSLIVTNVTVEIIRHYSAVISKILITPITMVLNFVVMKNLIEKL